MGQIQVLDCTLRDGGYCNEWYFRKKNIETIIDSLINSRTDIVECGFLNHKIEYDQDYSKFNRVRQINEIIGDAVGKTQFVIMANYGELDVNKLENCSGSGVTGIRVAFHKKDVDDAIALCKEIAKKGYKVFVQAMVSLNYTDEEFISLIKNVNNFKPYAFYIVDSFGVMKKNDLIRLFYLVDHNLDRDIKIGFHSHNNMQLSFSNAQALASLQTSRDIIIDTSIMGMGRGAGNLNTELFIEYLNNYYSGEYNIYPILLAIDNVINKFYQTSYWGYSLPNYLSAKHNIHPNYAKYLVDRNTLNVEDIEKIFSMISKEQGAVYDKTLIKKLYEEYMNKGSVTEGDTDFFNSYIKGKKILMIAPGHSAVKEQDKIKKFISSNSVCSLSVNFDYEIVKTNFVFVSNIRRYNSLNGVDPDRLIITSNIQAEKFLLKLDHKKLLNDIEPVSDNAGLMAVKFFLDFGVDKVYLAGFDGYNVNVSGNYLNSDMDIVKCENNYSELNSGMKEFIGRYGDKIEFITDSVYLKR